MCLCVTNACGLHMHAHVTHVVAYTSHLGGWGAFPWDKERLYLTNVYTNPISQGHSVLYTRIGGSAFCWIDTYMYMYTVCLPEH